MNEIENLHNLLVSLNITLGKLLAAEKEKTVALETGDAEKLSTLINIEQALVMECSAAEKRRAQMCDQLGVLSMSELYEKYPQSKEYIAPVHSELLCSVNLLKKTGVLNNKLLETRLGIIKLMNSQLGIDMENIQYKKTAGYAVNDTHNAASNNNKNR